MKVLKQRRLIKVKELLDNQKKEDIKLKLDNGTKGRSLEVWLGKINLTLPSSYKFRNKRELASIFKLFKFKVDKSEKTSYGCFFRIKYYRYIGGYKNGNKKIN